MQIYKVKNKSTQSIYYLTSDKDTRFCEICKSKIDRAFFLRRIEVLHNYWVERILCPKHSNSDKKVYNKALMDFVIMISVVDNIPDEATVYIGMSSATKVYGKGDVTVYDAAVMNFDGETIIDNTKYALRESWEGSQIGANVDELLENKDKPILKNQEAFDLLDDLQRSQPVLPNVTHERIEDKRE